MSSSTSSISGTTWNITTQWQNDPNPDYYTATFNPDGSLTILPTNQSFTARANGKANGFWTSNGQMISFCVAAFADPSTGAPDAAGGYGGLLNGNNLGGYASGYAKVGGPAPQYMPGTWAAVQVLLKK